MTDLLPAPEGPAISYGARAGTLPPYPKGWFCVGFSADLPAGAVERVTFAGRESVLFRTASGRLGLLDAYCPHLGAHLGRGGRVADETIRCPFHGFTFDTAGRCRSTSYGQPRSPRLAVATRPVEERHGLILAWHGGETVEWHVPEASTEGWTAWSTRTSTIVAHPQDTVENGVDIGHFAAVHNYLEVTPLDELKLDGPRLGARYQVRRRRGLGAITMDYTIDAHGLGHSLVETHIPELGMRVRQLILASPVDGKVIQLRLALSIYRSSPGGAHNEPFPSHRDLDRSGPGRRRRWKGLNLAAAIAATDVGRWLVQRWAVAAFAADIQQDVAVWQHKRYVHRPALVPGDGPIASYRRWAEQFYGPESWPETSGEAFCN